MTRIYLAATLPLLSVVRDLAFDLRGDFEVVSTWHDDTPTVEGERTLSRREQAGIAGLCLREVALADALVLVYGAPTARHGATAEAFFALGQATPVVAVGASAGAPLPTILLLGSRLVTRPELPLPELGAGGVAYHVRQAVGL